MRRSLIPLAIWLAGSLACQPVPAPATTPPVPLASPTPLPYAATVNGAPIPRRDYERRLGVQKALIQGIDLESDQGRAIAAQMAVDTLNQMIDFEILKQAAAARGVNVTEAEIDQRLNGPSGGEAWSVMRASLSEQKADPDYFRRLIEQQILSEKMMATVITDVPAVTEQVRIRRIAVETEADAKVVKAEVAAGQDFAQVAQNRSLDPESRGRGGDVGFYPRGIVAPEVEQVAFGLPVGGVSDPLKTPLGYEVIQVAERSPNRPVSPEYQQILREKKFTEWLRQQRAQATIEYTDAKG